MAVDIGNMAEWVAAMMTVVSAAVGVGAMVDARRSKGDAAEDRRIAQELADSARREADSAAEHLKMAEAQATSAARQAAASEDSARSSGASASAATSQAEYTRQIADALKSMASTDERPPVWEVTCTAVNALNHRSYLLRNTGGEAVAPELRSGAGAWGPDPRGRTAPPATLRQGASAEFFVQPFKKKYSPVIGLKSAGYDFVEIELPSNVNDVSAKFSSERKRP